MFWRKGLPLKARRVFKKCPCWYFSLWSYLLFSRLFHTPFHFLSLNGFWVLGYRISIFLSSLGFNEPLFIQMRASRSEFRKTRSKICCSPSLRFTQLPPQQACHPELIFVTNITNYILGEKIVMWRKIGKFWKKSWEILRNFGKFWEILGFATIYALSCGEKLSPKLHLWRKNDKYEVWLPPQLSLPAALDDRLSDVGDRWDD